MIAKKEFNALSSQVKDVYPDFVTCLYSECVHLGLVEPVYEYMRANKEASTDDVCHYLDKLTGYYRPNVVIVDDEKEVDKPLQYA